MPEPHADFDAYFHKRASRFTAFYRSEAVARLLGRGALFDRLRQAVVVVAAVGARRVLDVGCGNGILFEPLAEMGVHVVGIDPAPAMVAMARINAEFHPDLLTVEERGWESLKGDAPDGYDAAVALGVFDYVADAVALLGLMSKVAPHVVASFPAPGLRLKLRQVRYGARGVGVHPYTRHDLSAAASACGLEVTELIPLGRAGYLAHFSRRQG